MLILHISEELTSFQDVAAAMDFRKLIQCSIYALCAFNSGRHCNVTLTKEQPQVIWTRVNIHSEEYTKQQFSNIDDLRHTIQVNIRRDTRTAGMVPQWKTILYIFMGNWKRVFGPATLDGQRVLCNHDRQSVCPSAVCDKSSNTSRHWIFFWIFLWIFHQLSPVQMI